MNGPASKNKEETEEIDIMPALKKYGPWAVIALLSITMMGCGATGFYSVRPGEEAAVRTFGKAREQTVSQEGLHWHWPFPIGKVDVWQTGKNRTAEIGYFTLPEGRSSIMTGENWERDLQAATMITGDLNLVEVQAVAQYRISDLNKYLFRADDPGMEFEYSDQEDQEIRSHRSHEPGRPDGRSIRDAMEIAVRKAMGLRNIDQALVSQRESVEAETMAEAQQILDRWQTGIAITAVQLQEIKPPDPVQEAFDDVLRAREERDTRINSALSYESKVLPEACGQAEQIRQQAQAYAAQQINRAQGGAERFIALLEEYRAAPETIAWRMYLETIENVAPNIEFLIIDEWRPVIISRDGARIVPITQRQEETP